uniref:sn-glycerol-3-phosphate-binding periplasmic protein UgpB n=1 Tax=Treponema maltophilum TaxID=51160 RepID=Q8GBR8_TREMA|nr:putative periplasmatic sugar binding protein [Treponema maltophilum]
MLKKMFIVTAVLAAAVPTLFIGCSGKGGASGAGKEVKIFSSVTGGKDEAENVAFAEAIGKATGYKIDLEKVTANAETVLMQKLSAEESYDLIYFNQFLMYKFAKDGILQDLTDRINKSSILKENYPAGELEKIKFNGKYYAGFNKLEGYPLPNVNKAITDKAGVDIGNLTTLDDFYNMLKTVKNYMETKEGKKPYYPFFVYMNDIWDLQPWFSAVGARRGVFVDNTGKKYSPYVQDSARPVWEWLAKLYKEGLLDPASFTGKTGDMRSKMWQSQDIVLDSDWSAWTGLYNNNAKAAGTYPEKVNVVAILGAKSPDGKYLLEQGGASLWGIPTNAKNPDGAFKVLEYFATKEGGLLLSAGIEGIDYTMENGKLVFTETGIKHAKNHGAPFPISTKFDFSLLGEMNPGVAEALAYAKRDDVDIAAMGFANGELDARQYYNIMSKWMSDCIMGKIDAASAMKGAADELRSKGIID